jgi:DNA-binding transcriptional ArsR family regulator
LMAIASDTRLEILKSLVHMRRTVSQLSEVLDIDKAAVHRHLKKMEDGGLVKRDEDHGFVYYGLTWKARDLLSPNENTRIVILLSVSWILGLVVALFVAAGLMAQGGNDALCEMLAVGDPTYSQDRATDPGDTAVFSTWTYPAVSLSILAATSMALALWLARIPRQACPENAVGIERPDEPSDD